MLECNFWEIERERRKEEVAAYGHNKSISILKWEKQGRAFEEEKEEKLQKSLCINRDHERKESCWKCMAIAIAEEGHNFASDAAINVNVHVNMH